MATLDIVGKTATADAQPTSQIRNNLSDRFGKQAVSKGTTEFVSGDAGGKGRSESALASIKESTINNTRKADTFNSELSKKVTEIKKSILSFTKIDEKVKELIANFKTDINKKDTEILKITTDINEKDTEILKITTDINEKDTEIGKLRMDKRSISAAKVRDKKEKEEEIKSLKDAIKANEDEEQNVLNEINALGAKVIAKNAEVNTFFTWVKSQGVGGASAEGVVEASSQ